MSKPTGPPRVCGAVVEHSRQAQRACWCRGLFCGPGGRRASDQFYADFKTRRTAASEEQFQELARQGDLFDGAALRLKWTARVFAVALVKPTGTSRAPAAAAGERWARQIKIAARDGGRVHG